MRISIPGLSGVYYDTDAESTAVTVALSAAGRRAPKPKGYALQLLPHFWSFDVDLREVPADHPIQYLHPEGAQSLETLMADRPYAEVGRELERVLQFVWAVNREVETTAERMVGRRGDEDGVVIGIEDGSVRVDGDELEDDSFDVDHDEPKGTEIDIETDADAEADRDVDESTSPEETDATDESDVEDGDESDAAGTGGVEEFDPSSDEFDPDAGA